MAQAKIDILPDEILLEIFGFYLVDAPNSHPQALSAWSWPILIHVCRRWRMIVFASPCRLDLRIRCTGGSRMKEMFDIWPILPINIWAIGTFRVRRSRHVDNIIAALGHNDRIRRIWVDSSHRRFLERIATVIQEPLPALTDLHIASMSTVAVFPKAFLGRSAPRLRYLSLDRIAFSKIKKLLSTANHLVRLRLLHIPHSAYISPEALVTCLSAMPNLERLRIEFQSPRFRPNRHPPPLTRIVLPALTHFRFQGAIEYIEHLVSPIDVPLLHYACIRFFHQLTSDTPRQLHDFLSRAEKLTAHNHATVYFGTSSVTFQLQPESLSLEVQCASPESRLLSMTQICSSPLHPFSTLERLDICEVKWPHDMDKTQWLELLRPFTALKDLYLSEEPARHFMPILQKLAREGTAEDLPALQNIFIEGPPSGYIQKVIMEFIMARQLSGHPITVHGPGWGTDSAVMYRMSKY